MWEKLKKKLRLIFTREINKDEQMKINYEKLNSIPKMSIPNTKNSKHPEGFFGFFEPKDGYNKLVAYGPHAENFQLVWVHRDYLA
jgi:hypothetical protein